MIQKQKGCNDIYGREAKVWKYVESVIDAAMNEFGRIDVLINNAQASASGITLQDHTTEQFDLAIYSGLYATFYYMKACYPYLKETKGSVINFASGAGLFGNFGPRKHYADFPVLPQQNGHATVSTPMWYARWHGQHSLKTLKKLTLRRSKQM